MQPAKLLLMAPAHMDTPLVPEHVLPAFRHRNKVAPVASTTNVENASGVGTWLAGAVVLIHVPRGGVPGTLHPLRLADVTASPALASIMSIVAAVEVVVGHVVKSVLHSIKAPVSLTTHLGWVVGHCASAAEQPSKLAAALYSGTGRVAGLLMALQVDGGTRQYSKFAVGPLVALP